VLGEFEIDVEILAISWPPGNAILVSTHLLEVGDKEQVSPPPV